MLGGIGISTFVCSLGIFVLLEKNKDKGPAIHSVVNQTYQEEKIEMGKIAISIFSQVIRVVIKLSELSLTSLKRYDHHG